MVFLFLTMKENCLFLQLAFNELLSSITIQLLCHNNNLKIFVTCKLLCFNLFQIYFVGQVNLENVRSEVPTEQIIDMQLLPHFQRFHRHDYAFFTEIYLQNDRFRKMDTYSLDLLADQEKQAVFWGHHDEVKLSDLRSLNSLYCIVCFLPTQSINHRSAILCHFQHKSVSCLVNTRRKQGHFTFTVFSIFASCRSTLIHHTHTHT